MGLPTKRSRVYAYARSSEENGPITIGWCWAAGTTITHISQFLVVAELALIVGDLERAAAIKFAPCSEDRRAKGLCGDHVAENSDATWLAGIDCMNVVQGSSSKVGFAAYMRLAASACVCVYACARA